MRFVTTFLLHMVHLSNFQYAQLIRKVMIVMRTVPVPDEVVLLVVVDVQDPVMLDILVRVLAALMVSSGSCASFIELP